MSIPSKAAAETRGVAPTAISSPSQTAKGGRRGERLLQAGQAQCAHTTPPESVPAAAEIGEFEHSLNTWKLQQEVNELGSPDDAW